MDVHQGGPAGQAADGGGEEFDFDESTEQAWTLFTGRLAEVVSVVDDGSVLTVGTLSGEDERSPWISFAVGARPSREQDPVVHMEAASNASLGDGFQLVASQLDQLEQLGWQPPTSEGPHPTSNFFVDHVQDDCTGLAALAVATLRDVYGVQHPVFLAPDHLAEILSPDPARMEVPEPAGVLDEHDAVAQMPGSREQLDRWVALELTQMFGHEPIRDAEGDYTIRVGSTMVFVRTAPDAREVVLFSALVHDLEGRSRAAEVLNDLNSESRFGRFSLSRDRVFVSMSLLARPFVPAHLHEGVRIICEIADGIDDELAGKLRGRVTFGEDE